jgi:hypothetical protein
MAGKPNAMGNNEACDAGMQAAAARSNIIKVRLVVLFIVYYPPLIKNTVSVD